MKSIFLTAALFAAATTVSFAQQDTTEAPSADTTAFAPQDMSLMASVQEEKAIKKEELPEAVQAALKNEKYKGWNIESATAVQSADGVWYRVVISDGKKTETVKLDEEGNTVA